jgi:serine/threonine-protein kinase
MPEAFAHFKILSTLGSGGLGTVYRARDTRLGRTVALKVLPPSLTLDAPRLEELREVALRLTTLSHPNITSLFEGGEDGPQKFLAFEYVQGEPLTALINGRELNVRRAVEYAINLADALAEAHASGFTHGDIRPDTIVVTQKDRAKLMNFGLSKFTAGGALRLTRGSPYVAPEELEGRRGDPRSDIYSLGAVIFEMATGRPRARGAVASGANPAVPVELDRVLGRMLASNIEHRAQNASTIAAELRSLAAVLDSRTEAAEKASRLPGKRSGGRGVLYALIALGAGLAALAAWMSR